MIWQFEISCRDENGKTQHEVAVIHNGRLILKDKGSAEEILQHVFAMLINSPQQFYIYFNVIGSDEDIKSYKTMLNEWKLKRTAPNPEPVLTPRQLECRKLLMEGKSIKQIGQVLCIGYVWARDLCSQVYEAYHCHTKGELLSILLNKQSLF